MPTIPEAHRRAFERFDKLFTPVPLTEGEKIKELPAMPSIRKIYVASRASIPERSEMWRQLRASGWLITSTWIDEAGEGETADFSELWSRITQEIQAADALILYAEAGDFPLKGALVEVGIAIGMGKRIYVCLPDVTLEGRTDRPAGSWIRHPLVSLISNLQEVSHAGD